MPKSPRRRPAVREDEPDLVYDPTNPPEPVLAETAKRQPVAADPEHPAPTAHQTLPLSRLAGDASRPVPAMPPANPTRAVTYQSRIRVIDAWQYGGNLKDAPDFVDRNWAGWDDTPILRVPHYARPDGEPVICRVMDYVVRQEVKLAEGMPTMERVEVWPKEEFERLFIPHRINGEDPAKASGPKAPSPMQSMQGVNLKELLDDLAQPSERSPEEPQST
jgi:hypothetical protein